MNIYRFRTGKYQRCVHQYEEYQRYSHSVLLGFYLESWLTRKF